VTKKGRAPPVAAHQSRACPHCGAASAPVVPAGIVIQINSYYVVDSCRDGHPGAGAAFPAPAAPDRRSAGKTRLDGSPRSPAVSCRASSPASSWRSWWRSPPWACTTSTLASPPDSRRGPRHRPRGRRRPGSSPAASIVLSRRSRCRQGALRLRCLSALVAASRARCRPESALMPWSQMPAARSCAGSVLIASGGEHRGRRCPRCRSC